MRRHLEKVTVILISANLERIRSISRHQSNFSDSSLHLLQSFKVCLDTARGYSLTLTKQNQVHLEASVQRDALDVGKKLWTWGSSSEFTQLYPPQEACSGMAGNASLGRASRGEAQILLLQEYQISGRGQAWTDSPKQRSCPNNLKKKLMRS